MSRYNTLFLLLMFALGFGVATAWQEIKFLVGFYPVQRLKSPDHRHQAILERIDFLDANFRIKLDGKEIYWSPDFTPNRTLPFRETLLWDATGKYLLFEVGGHRLFGYDAQQQRRLTNTELLRAKVIPVPFEKFRFEGRSPDAQPK